MMKFSFGDYRLLQLTKFSYLDTDQNKFTFYVQLSFAKCVDGNRAIYNVVECREKSCNLLEQYAEF